MPIHSAEKVEKIMRHRKLNSPGPLLEEAKYLSITKSRETNFVDNAEPPHCVRSFFVLHANAGPNAQTQESKPRELSSSPSRVI